MCIIFRGTDKMTTLRKISKGAQNGFLGENKQYIMDFISELFLPGNTSIASTLVLYSFVIAAGIYIGKMRICGVSLGVTFVLFVGILMGAFRLCGRQCHP